MSLDGQTEVGKVTKQWTGIVNEMFTDADTFGITCKFSFLSYTLLYPYLEWGKGLRGYSSHNIAEKFGQLHHYAKIKP